jgi:1-acyl-sn-glycerol-3-phosphate acyltransferase
MQEMLAPVQRTPGCGRDPLISAITMFLRREDGGALDDIRAALAREIDAAGAESLALLADRLAVAGTDWAYYPSDPLARRIHHLLARRVLDHEPVLHGVEHLPALGRPVIIFANHLSYSDANLLEVVLHRAAPALSDRLTAMAGPKVYSNLRRRFSSLCFGTIKIPQNTGVSSGEAVMRARDVAIAARRSLAVARQRLHAGDALLLFPEGSRSRSAAMQPLLPGVARYLELADAWVVPVGIAGTEALFPIGEESLNAVRLVTTIGRPIDGRRLREHARGNRRLMMDCIGVAIAELLPPSYRGVYGDRRRYEEPRRLVGSAR